MKHFPSKDFSWINDILLLEEERESAEDVPSDWVCSNNVIDVENIDVMETRLDEPEDPTPV